MSKAIHRMLAGEREIPVQPVRKEIPALSISIIQRVFIVHTAICPLLGNGKEGIRGT